MRGIIARRSARPSSPLLVGVVAALGALVVLVPIVSLVIKAPWSDLSDVLGRHRLRDALGLSLATSTIATVVVVGLGVPLGHVLTHTEGRGWRWLRAGVLLPLVLPPVAGGMALLMAFGRHGVLGGPLELAGIELPFSTAGVVAAQVFVALPFVVISAESAFASLDPHLRDAAAVHGAGPLATFFTVELPAARSGVAAGAALGWARSLGELGATLTFAGDLPGRTRTAPLAILAGLESNPPEAVLLSVVLLAVAVVVLLALRGRWWPGAAWRGPLRRAQP